MNRKQRAYQQFVNNPKVSSDEEFQKQLQDIVKSYSTEITPVYTTKQDISKERKQIRQTQQRLQPFLVPEGWGSLTINKESANPVKRYQDSKKRSENAKDTKWVTPDQNVIKNYKLDKVLKKNPESEYAKLTDPRYVKSLMVNNDSQMYGQLQTYDPKRDTVNTFLPDGTLEKMQSFSEWSNQRLKEQGQLEDKFVQSMGDVNYFQSAYNTFQQNRNMAERDYFAGNILRTNEMLSYANDAEQYLNNQNKINEYSNIMDAADLYKKGQNKEALLPYLRKHGLILLNGGINLIRLPNLHNPITIRIIPAIIVAIISPSMPWDALIPATIVANAAVGPAINSANMPSIFSPRPASYKSTAKIEASFKIGSRTLCTSVTSPSFTSFT